MPDDTEAKKALGAVIRRIRKENAEYAEKQALYAVRVLGYKEGSTLNQIELGKKLPSLDRLQMLAALPEAKRAGVTHDILLAAYWKAKGAGAGAAGTEDIGKFIRNVRAHSIPAIDSFAAAMNVDVDTVKSVESGAALPSGPFMAAVLPFVRKANANDRNLLYMWLEAQGMSAWVATIKTPRKG